MVTGLPVEQRFNSQQRLLFEAKVPTNAIPESSPLPYPPGVSFLISAPFLAAINDRRDAIKVTAQLAHLPENREDDPRRTEC